MESRLIQKVDLLDIISKISKRNKKLQAVLLSHLEEICDRKEFESARKLILDETNEYTRYIIREIFGDIEYVGKK